MPDEILRELWETKDQIARECDHDLRRLFDRLKAAQKSSSHPKVNRTRSPNRSGTTTGPPAPESTQART